MKLKVLNALLHAWGRVYGERLIRDEETGEAFIARDYGLPDTRHALDRAQSMAPGSRANYARGRTTMDRAGFDRRVLMARAAGVEGMAMVPAHFCDPVYFAETRSSSPGPADWPIPPELQRIERAALDLLKADRLIGLCLRQEFCARGKTQADKAKIVEGMMGESVSLRRYREALQHGKGFVHSRVIA